MRHAPFLQFLVLAENDDTPLCREVSAGYLVLSLFDRWRDDGPAILSAHAKRPALDHAVQAKKLDPDVRAMLLSAMRGMANTGDPCAVAVTAPLWKYAQYLTSAGRPELAAHVDATIRAIARSSDALGWLADEALAEHLAGRNAAVI